MLHFSEIIARQDNQKHHEDGYATDTSQSLMVVCDGVSGAQGNGEMAAIAFQKHFRDRNDLKEAVLRVIDEQQHDSTIVVARIRDQLLEVCSVGDSRAYLIEDDCIIQLTSDHNLLQVIHHALPAGIDPRQQGINDIVATLASGEFDQELLYTIAEEIFGDRIADIFSNGNMESFLASLHHDELLTRCRKEVLKHQYSETLLGLIIASSRAILTHHLNKPRSKKIVKVRSFHIKAGQEVMVCSDGFHGNFENDDLRSTNDSRKNLTEWTTSLFEKARSRRVRDDMTLLMGRIAG